MNNDKLHGMDVLSCEYFLTFGWRWFLKDVLRGINNRKINKCGN
jgi:hypothetical protein